MKIFNHVQIKVRDLKTSRRLYDAIMDILDYPVVLDIKNVVVGYGTSSHDMFEIRQFDKESSLSNSIHLAFNASSIKSVDAFYYAALANGAKCNGKPGFRPEYEEGYYAAFVIDPDGHNIEAVFATKP
ncbi:glyoxalase/bleomycin resistance protein [Legionella busanensis]|uniref:Glyoxalase/bleomycin resistance protein n=1 Tax=Legionella busanensis TaxID=190655 RepID=A0A378K9J4_9GAMM|nr:VOC family protein [Legionella busanensis]STX81618.1 glyoxalase/bleomycin resistance protein [Legionella busanensis]